MELKTESFKKVINPDNNETEYEITTTYEETHTTTLTIPQLEARKANHQAEIDKLNTKISDLEKL
jgi:hypothetical protein|tara:strand:+ start:813 stop:1007 length:195 start_codon:yes stop_codon:yes gene_type:complete